MAEIASTTEPCVADLTSKRKHEQVDIENDDKCKNANKTCTLNNTTNNSDATCRSAAHSDDACNTNSAVIEDVVLDPATGEPLSKRKLKKLKKAAKWEANKYIKRQQERDRKKERKKEMREKGISLGPSRKALKKNKMTDSSCKVKVVVDCSFDGLMTDKDIGDIVKQLSHSYAANRRAENPLQFYVTSVEKKMKMKMDAQPDTKFWDIYLQSESYEELFEKSDIVYLSSDSDNVLDTLTEDKVYVIGGLVDHNHHKGLCHRIAEEKGLYHAKLPITEFIQLHSRKVLSINQVFEILVAYTETNSWEEAFLKALPKRKGAMGKSLSGPKNDTTDAVKTLPGPKTDPTDAVKTNINEDIAEDNNTMIDNSNVSDNIGKSSVGQKTDTTDASKTNINEDITSSVNVTDNIGKSLLGTKTDTTDASKTNINEDNNATIDESSVINMGNDNNMGNQKDTEDISNKTIKDNNSTVPDNVGSKNITQETSSKLIDVIGNKTSTVLDHKTENINVENDTSTSSEKIVS